MTAQMKKEHTMKAMTLTAAACLFGSGSAFAGNLVNKDVKAYDVDVTCDGATTHTTLAAKATQEDLVSKGCVIKIKGGAAHTVKGDKDITIKDGKLGEA